MLNDFCQTPDLLSETGATIRDCVILADLK